MRRHLQSEWLSVIWNDDSFRNTNGHLQRAAFAGSSMYSSALQNGAAGTAVAFKELLNCGGRNTLFEQGRGAALRIKTLSHDAHDDTIH